MTGLGELVLKTLNALEKRDLNMLREISHNSSEEAAVSQDEKVIKIALITYCFNKLLSKVHYREHVERLINESTEKLGRQDLDGVLTSVEGFDRKHGYFEGNLVEKAKIKIASRLYSSGLSISQSAELLDVRVSELLDYVGVTKIHNEVETMTAIERLKKAREILK